MHQSSLTRLDGYVRSGSLELFGAYGVSLAETAPGGKVSEDAFAATIGFANPVMRGALIMTMCRELVVKSLPSQMKGPDPAIETVADWTGELANQLLGRIKKKLLLTGLDITLCTPVVFKGNKMSHFPQHSKVSRVLGFTDGEHHMDVELQAYPENGYEIPDPVTDEAGMNEGDVSLF